jgi:hypothetical protein
VVVELQRKSIDFPLKSRSAERPCDLNAPPLSERVPNQKIPKENQKIALEFYLLRSVFPFVLRV